MQNGFSVLLATWNNIEYLKIFIDGFYSNSFYKNHELIIHVNESKDGTLAWLQNQNIKTVYSEKNIGLCKPINDLVKISTKDWICITEDDIYMLPNWDKELVNYYVNNRLNTNVWLSSTYLEKRGNPTSIYVDYGDCNNFKKDALLLDYKKYSLRESKINISNTPMIVNKTLWNKINGFDENFGIIGSEEVLAKKMFDVGVRDFITVPSSLVYHFQSKSTNLIRNQNSGKVRDNQFHEMFGQDISFFRKELRLWENV